MIEDLENEDMDLSEDVPDEKKHNVAPEISFHVIFGNEHPQTLRLLGRIKGSEMGAVPITSSIRDF